MSAVQQGQLAWPSHHSAPGTQLATVKLRVTRGDVYAAQKAACSSHALILSGGRLMKLEEALHQSVSFTPQAFVLEVAHKDPQCSKQLGTHSNEQYAALLQAAATGHGTLGLVLTALCTSAHTPPPSHLSTPASHPSNPYPDSVQVVSSRPWPGGPGSLGMRFSMHLQQCPQTSQTHLVITHEPLLPAPSSHSVSSPLLSQTRRPPTRSQTMEMSGMLITVNGLQTDAGLTVHSGSSSRDSRASPTFSLANKAPTMAKRAMLVAAEAPWSVTLVCIQVRFLRNRHTHTYTHTHTHTVVSAL